jgi:hypothetical protein
MAGVHGFELRTTENSPQSAADLHAMLPSLCVVIVRVFCSTFLIVCVPFQFIQWSKLNCSLAVPHMTIKNHFIRQFGAQHHIIDDL